MPARPPKDYGGGLSIKKPSTTEPHPAGPPKHGELGQAERAFTLASTFMSGILAISASQFIGAPLKLIDPTFYEAYMAYTKESFAVLITSLTQWWAPTVVRVSGDASVRGQLVQAKDGTLQCKFPKRLVLMANHQLYTDWLYLWWVAYTNRMHGYIYIILKESLKNIPIIGWGCQFYNFIFLSRKWETDMPRFKQALGHLKKASDPMWLLIFPEGTNLSATTREKSKAWATKTKVQDMKHQLLPRSTGLKFCLQELQDTTEWLYDCTIAYEGVPPGQFGQDVFTLRSSFLEGRPPKSVNMHWRRFKIADIPMHSNKAFEVWLRNRWREKDYMLEYFSRHSRFPAEDYWKEQLADGESEKASSISIRSVARPARTFETEVKAARFEEFLRIFAPITALAMALFVAYGADPSQLPFPDGGQFLQKNLGTLMSSLTGPGSMGDMEKMLEQGPALLDSAKGMSLGNTPADKAKQQKYLQLFKSSLPPEIGLQAEQRKRMQSFIDGLPSKEEARKAAIAGAKTPFVERSKARASKAATVANGPVRGAAAQKPGQARAHSVHGGPAAALKTATTKTAANAGVKIVTEVKNGTSKPRFAVVNGVRIQLQSTGTDTEPEKVASGGDQFIQTKTGLKIKQPRTSTIAPTVKNEPSKGFIQTKGGIRIKQPTAVSTVKPPSQAAPNQVKLSTHSPIGTEKYPSLQGAAATSNSRIQDNKAKLPQKFVTTHSGPRRVQ